VHGFSGSDDFKVDRCSLPIRSMRLSAALICTSALGVSKKMTSLSKIRMNLPAIAGLAVTGFPAESRSIPDQLIGCHS